MPRRHHLTISHLAALALLSSSGTLPSTAAAEDLEAEDVPSECAAVCAPIVQLTARCEAQTTQRFGDLDKRFVSFPPSSFPFPPLRKRRRKISRRQDDDDSDSENEGGGATTNPATAAAAEQATRTCVCGERGFDVQAVMGACAVCVAANPAAVEANEDIKEIMAECGFAVPAAPAAPVVTSTPPVVAPPVAAPPVATPPAAAPPAAAPIPGFSTLPPAMLAPIEPSSLPPSSTSSTSSSTPPPPPAPPPSTSAEETPTPQPPPPPATTPDQTPTQPAPAAPSSSAPNERSITPVTVFETPTFRTLPPIVSPNDASPPKGELLLSGAAAAAAGPMGGWFRWAVYISVVVFILR